VLLSFNAQPLLSVDELHSHLAEEAIGASATLEYLRGGERRSVTVIPRERA